MDNIKRHRGRLHSDHPFGELFLTFLMICTWPLLNATTPPQLHCLGNGDYCLFGQGADIESVFGPGYSSPSYIQLSVKGGDSTLSARIKGTAIWQHTIYEDGKVIARLTDFTDSKAPTFTRMVECYAELSFEINILEDEKITIADDFHSMGKDKSSSLLIYKERGLPIYGNYSHPYEQFQHIYSKGNSSLTKMGDFKYKLNLRPGKSELFLIGGSTFQECVDHTHMIDHNTSASLFERAKEHWLDYTGKRYDFEKLIPDNLPGKEEIIHQIDNVAVILKTQQSDQGSVIAGHRYHLAYVRDQYGVSRGFLAMGYFEEARDILKFYWDIWKDFGYIHNAQAIGIPGIFHQHENDEVEITGYLIIQAFDYLEKTKDTAFVKEIFPMLEWAWNAQKKNLVSGMLPFNGDETYVAGGILPRSALNDGSAEATLLFLEAGKRLMPFIEQNQLWEGEMLERNKALIHSTVATYPDNFILNRQIVANNPSRMTIEEMPAFRHGFCAGSHGVLETRKDDNGNYLCPKCIAEGLSFPPIDRKTYFLPSLALTPEYIGSDLIAQDILDHNLSLIKENYRQKGEVSSRGDSNITIGYEYGFFLYALTKQNDLLAARIIGDMLSVVDEVGAWVEYYNNGVPMGCNYRPWESAINIEAIILYALNYEDEEKK